MIKKLVTITFLSLLVFACHPQIKPTKVSRAPQIKVLLAQVSQIDSLEFNGTFTLQLEEAVYELGKKNKKFFISPSQSGFKLYNSNRLFVFSGPDRVQLQPTNAQNARFKFRNKWFKGKIILSLNPEGAISIINQVDLEEYLKSVLVGEMPSNQDSYLEALKAQAICARTYALRRMEQNANKPFHVYADVRDQVYASLKRRTNLADRAVDATRGVVLMFNDDLAQTYFHSTCGGISEDITNYWTTQPIPYLKSRKDVLGEMFTCQPSPYFRWQRTFTIYELDSLLQKNFKYSIFPAVVKDTTLVRLTVNVKQRTSSGRVKTLQIALPDTSFELTNFSIRRFFSKKSKVALPSLLFKLEAQNDSILVIHGGGYGHGVGMCQWGALNMSQLGFKYYDILVNQYFPGTYLKEMY